MPESHVAVVLPLAREKTIRWIDKSTGEISAPRKSTKKDNIYASFRELYKIRDFIGNKNLEIKLLFLSVDEYRYLDSKNGKRGAVRAECIIKEVLDEISITSKSDFISFLPSGLNEEFTVKDFARAAGLPLKRISYIISFLRIVGAIEQCGMCGRAYLYKKSRIL